MNDTKLTYIPFISEIGRRTKRVRARLGRLVRWEFTGVCVIAAALTPLALLYGELVETTPLSVVVGFMVSFVAVTLGLTLIALRTWLERRDRLAAAAVAARARRERAGRVAPTQPG